MSEVNGVTEPIVAKRLKGTPERIELENYRLSMMREEELEEVPEETQAEHNLSSVLDKATDVDEGSRYLTHMNALFTLPYPYVFFNPFSSNH